MIDGKAAASAKFRVKGSLEPLLLILRFRITLRFTTHIPYMWLIQEGPVELTRGFNALSGVVAGVSCDGKSKARRKKKYRLCLIIVQIARLNRLARFSHKSCTRIWIAYVFTHSGFALSEIQLGTC